MNPNLSKFREASDLVIEKVKEKFKGDLRIEKYDWVTSIAVSTEDYHPVVEVSLVVKSHEGDFNLTKTEPNCFSRSQKAYDREADPEAVVKDVIDLIVKEAKMLENSLMLKALSYKNFLK